MLWLVVALLANGLVDLFNAWLSRGLSLGMFELAPVVSFVCGLLLGWPGVLGSALGQAATHAALSGQPALSIGLGLCLGAVGAIAYGVFRAVPGLGRGLPDLRSYLWMLSSALLGVLVVALAGGAFFFGENPAVRIWSWNAKSLINVVLFAPPLLLAADRWLRRFIVPIPGELPARRSYRLGNGDESPQVVGDATVLIVRPRSRPGRVLATGGLLVLAVSAVVVPLTSLLPAGSAWTLLLYLIPVLWLAMRTGLRGGVLAASASGICYLAGLSAVQVAGASAVSRDLWAVYSELVILSLVGAVVGATRDEETRVREELIESNRLLRRDLLRVVEALTHAVEAKDAYTEGHLRRVSEYAVAVGERMGLAGRDLENLHHASLLHDIGKLGVPENVLGKEGPLDATEAEVMRRHPEIGARLLEKLDALSEVAPIVLHHQERYDGGRGGDYPGYPLGLAGERIPLGARIIAVVDAFDAMTTDRPYRAALPADRAVEELREERGRQFDPRVVDAFVGVLAERPWHRASPA